MTSIAQEVEIVAGPDRWLGDSIYYRGVFIGGVHQEPFEGVQWCAEKYVDGAVKGLTTHATYDDAVRHLVQVRETI